MKKIIFITLLFCGLAFTVQSQSLQFSQVLLVSSLDTVPQGKVWKITSILATTSSTSNTSYHPSFKIDGYSHQAYGYLGNGTVREFPLPIGLPEGVTIQPIGFMQGFSIVEFTVNQ